MQPPSSAGDKPRVTGAARSVVLALDRGAAAFARHWLLVLNLFMAGYVGTPFLAPVLMKAGQPALAGVIYTVYSPLCHQLAYRSWFLFGEQSSYPRQEFQALTGIDPNDLWAARAFWGNPQMGYKVAFCERDVAIYGGLLLAGLVYGLPFVRGRLPALPWWAWVLIGLVPIGLDGFSQLFSQYPYNLLPGLQLLPPRESTPLLRTLTGALFGVANAWLAYPHVEISMREVGQSAMEKLTRAGAGSPPAGPA